VISEGGCPMSEDDLRFALLNELEMSMQTLSPYFMLNPRLKPFFVDSEHRLVDFLLYNRDIGRMIPIYLKFGDMDIDDIEWMKINIRILDKYKTIEEDNNTIGIILCVLDNTQHVELVKLEKSKGFISKYLIDLPLKQIFKGQLKNAVNKARKQLASGKGLGKNNEH